MTQKEKTLYHQIHPLKLFTDISTDILALYFFWQYQIGTALGILLIPALVVSLCLINFADLRPYKRSAFGKYMKRHMTTSMELARIAGGLAMIIGALNHSLYFIAAGFVIILYAWLQGLFKNR